MANILIIAAHPDDEVLGCGGTIAGHVSAGDVVGTVFVSDGVGARDKGDLAKESAARKEAAGRAAKLLGMQPPKHLDFPDNRLDSVDLLDVVQALEEIISSFKPRVIYTHHGGDLNVDHRITHQAVMTACRPQPGSLVQAIYAFEVLSSTEWSLPGNANNYDPRRFVDITEHLDAKLRAIECYQEEMRAFPHARSLEMVEYLARLRGGSVGLHAAEAFEVLRERVVFE